MENFLFFRFESFNDNEKVNFGVLSFTGVFSECMGGVCLSSALLPLNPRI